MFAALVLAGIVAAPIGTICLLIQPSRRRRVTGTWPAARRLLFAVAGTVVLAALAGLLQEIPPGLLEHRVVDRVLGGEVRVQRGLLHADPDRNVAQGQPGDAALARRVPGRLEDLPPRRLTPFGLPITIR